MGTRGLRDVGGMVRNILKLSSLGFQRRAKRLDAAEFILEKHRKQGAVTLTEANAAALAAETGDGVGEDAALSTLGGDRIISGQRASYVRKCAPCLGPVVDFMESVDEYDMACGCIPPYNPLRRCLLHVSASSLFQTFFMVVIVASSIALALEGRSESLDRPDAWRSADAVFAALFALEVIIKMTALGVIRANPFSFFRSGWNTFDFIVAVMAVIDVGIDSRRLGKEAEESGGSALLFIRLLRLGRTARPLKLLEFIPETRKILHSLANAVV